MKLGLSLLLSVVAFGTAASQTSAGNAATRIQILRGGAVRLSDEYVGTVADMNPLKTRLAEIFKNSRDESFSNQINPQISRTYCACCAPCGI
jgi:hypothetical protein